MIPRCCRSISRGFEACCCRTMGLVPLVVVYGLMTWAVWVELYIAAHARRMPFWMGMSAYFCFVFHHRSCSFALQAWAGKLLFLLDSSLTNMASTSYSAWGLLAGPVLLHHGIVILLVRSADRSGFAG